MKRKKIKANSRLNWAESVMKRKGFMNPVTFKFVIAHQKEYALQAKEIQSHNPATINRRKKWDIF